MKKLVVMVSARASYSRFRSALIQLARSDHIDLHIVLVASANSSRFGNLVKFIEQDGLRISWKIDSQIDISQKTSMAKTVGLTLLGLTDYLENVDPDALVIIADRHETIAGSISGSYLGIKTFHIQGGESTGNIDDRVRFANTHLSDYHFVANEVALERLRTCGVSHQNIFVTGCPSLDFVKDNKFDRIRIPNLTGLGLPDSKLFESEFLVVMQHPETSSKLDFPDQILPTIYAINEADVPTLWLWPNSDQGGESFTDVIRKAHTNGLLKNVHFERSLEPELFLSILDGASCIVGNSSVALRECSLIGTPAVNIGGRQSNRSHGSNVLTVQYDRSRILEAIVRQRIHGRYSPEFIYGNGESGKLIARLIEELI